MTFPVVFPVIRKKTVARLLATADFTNDSSSYTWTAAPIGPLTSDRFIAVTWVGAGVANRNFTSGTIDGVTATTLVGFSATGGAVGAIILGRPLGTTCDIGVQFSNTLVRSGAALWGIYTSGNDGVLATAAVTGTAQATIRSDNGVIISGSYRGTAIVGNGFVESYNFNSGEGEITTMLEATFPGQQVSPPRQH